MADLKLFLKSNKKEKSTKKYAATKSLCDAKGNPLEWELKAITTEENDKIRDDCTYEVPITGKPNMYRTKVNTSKYIAKMIAASIVFPDLNDAELQDSYGVMCAEDLIKKMVDNPAEYDDLAKEVQEFNGFDVDINDKVDEAKN